MTLDQLKKKIPKLNIKFIFLIWKAYAYMGALLSFPINEL